MQVFVPYPSPIDVAKCLDRRRLIKQEIELNQILEAIDCRSGAWKNHPVVKMYAPFRQWLLHYRSCIIRYNEGLFDDAEVWSKRADRIRPPFLTSDFCDQHKRRLYTKSPELYPQFWPYGESDENWYFVDGEIVKYINGKRI